MKRRAGVAGQVLVPVADPPIQFNPSGAIAGLPTAIESAELEYLRTLHQQVQTLEALKGAPAAMQSFAQFLGQRYQLQQGDSIKPEDGTIVRAKK